MREKNLKCLQGTEIELPKSLQSREVGEEDKVFCSGFLGLHWLNIYSGNLSSEIDSRQERSLTELSMLSFSVNCLKFVKILLRCFYLCNLHHIFGVRGFILSAGSSFMGLSFQQNEWCEQNIWDSCLLIQALIRFFLKRILCFLNALPVLWFLAKCQINWLAFCIQY